MAQTIQAGPGDSKTSLSDSEAVGTIPALAPVSAVEPRGRLRWLLGAILGGIWRFLVAVATHRLVRAFGAWLRDLASRALAWLWKRTVQLNDWIYRVFGKPITIGLTSTSFLWVALSPDANPLYQGVNWASDVDCMAMNIYHEARGEPELGKVAVGHVVMNRVMDPRFPSTVCGVITQGGAKPLRRCQFSWWCDGRDDKPQHQLSWVESHQIAAMIFSGKAKDPTGARSGTTPTTSRRPGAAIWSRAPRSASIISIWRQAKLDAKAAKVFSPGAAYMMRSSSRGRSRPCAGRSRR